MSSIKTNTQSLDADGGVKAATVSGEAVTAMANNGARAAKAKAKAKAKRGRPRLAAKVAKEPKVERTQPQSYEQLKTNRPPNPRVAHQLAVYERLVAEGIDFKHEVQVRCVKTQGRYYMLDFLIQRP